MSYTIIDQTFECEGMCFNPERVLTEIFTLESAYRQTGLPLESIEKNFYLQEVSRTICTIALQCRRQITSYFYQVPNATKASRQDRMDYVSKSYISADEAIKAVTGNLICPKNGLKPVIFYDMIGKLCHVEKWTYPVAGSIKAFDDQETESEGNLLLVDITKRGKEPVTGEVEQILVYIPWFVDAARVFITGCTECQLYRPVKESMINIESQCA